MERTEALHKLAYYDPVTRLPNQLLLLDEFAVANREGRGLGGRYRNRRARHRSIQLHQRDDGVRFGNGIAAVDRQIASRERLASGQKDNPALWVVSVQTSLLFLHRAWPVIVISPSLPIM